MNYYFYSLENVCVREAHFSEIECLHPATLEMISKFH